jgi:high-affinity K+ transport system ATPase subunit B
VRREVMINWIKEDAQDLVDTWKDVYGKKMIQAWVILAVLAFACFFAGYYTQENALVNYAVDKFSNIFIICFVMMTVLIAVYKAAKDEIKEKLEAAATEGE